jgi:hypothetical protein
VGVAFAPLSRGSKTAMLTVSAAGYEVARAMLSGTGQ